MKGYYLLLLDEFRHLFRVRFMIYVSLLATVFVPTLTLIQSGSGTVVPLSMTVWQFTFFLTLAAGGVIVSTLINDISNRTLVPFLVRPVSRFSILFSRVSALTVCVFGIMFFSLMLTKTAFHFLSVEVVTDQPLSLLLVMVFSQTLFVASLGLLLGVCVSSVATGVSVFIILGFWVHIASFGAVMSPRGWPQIVIGLAVFSLLSLLMSSFWMSKKLKKKVF